jgi:hypothetical protein
MTSSTRIRELFIIERGTPRLADLDHNAALDQLLANTDDAYGFPPFRYLAPAITIGGQGYLQLRAREREILSGFLSQVRVRTLASDTFGWADEIPRLVGGVAAPAGGTPGPVPDQRVPDQGETAADVWPRWGERLAYGRLAGDTA